VVKKWLLGLTKVPLGNQYFPTQQAFDFRHKNTSTSSSLRRLKPQHHWNQSTLKSVHIRSVILASSLRRWRVAFIALDWTRWFSWT
jgi:hypothetical protein